MKDTVIVRGLGKQYRHYHQDRPRTLQEFFQRGLRGLKPVEYFSSEAMAPANRRCCD